jgi:hypothetical protein
MKKKRSVLAGFAVLFLATVFTMGSCDTGMGGGVESVTYRTTSEGKTYTLVITASSGRAAYTPQKGDRYVLTVTPGNTRSVGTVTSSVGTVLTLKPANAASSFTVTVKTAGTEGAGGEISVITGTVILEDGNTLPGSGIVKPGSGGGGGSSGNKGTIGGGDNFPLPLTSVERAEAYYVYLALKGDGRGSAANPIVLPMKMDLGNGVDTLANLFSLIATKGKYVDLDLARCTMDGTEFDPDWELSTGKDRVVSLTLPDVAESIKANLIDIYPKPATFQHFMSLKTVSGNTIKSIGDNAFARYDFNEIPALTTVNFPVATSIGDHAFFGCEALTTVNIPSAVFIDIAAFGFCSSLTTVDFPEAASIGRNAFNSNLALTTVNLPKATSIGDQAFFGCWALTTVDFPAATSIGEHAFYRCDALNTVNLPLVTSIGAAAFMYCGVLTTVNLPVVTFIDGSAFMGNALLTVDFPMVTSIGAFAFAGCEALTMANLPAVIYIGLGAFGHTGTENLTITLPNAAPMSDTMTPVGNAYSKTVTIRRPADSTDYDDTWLANFREKVFCVNADITFIVEDL